MNYYLAPMEGITGYVFRQALQKHFQMPDKCITPFIAPNQNSTLKNREKREISPEHNQGMNVVPQILTNKADNFIETCKELKERGYQEVNLNLGCPSGTVVAKKRGSGFLSVPKELDIFLEQIFEQAELPISIKTRLGIANPEEFYEILEIYNKYPLSELIIHPRVQKDFYKNPPHMDIFREALKKSRHPICYNGDLFTVENVRAFQQEFPEVDRIMLGRGLVVNPGMIELLQEQPEEATTKEQEISHKKIITKERLKAFHDSLMEAYGSELYGDKNLLYKMKEIWFYQLRLFADSEKEEKKIRKVQHLDEYIKIVDNMFKEKNLVFAEQLYF